MKRYKLLGFYLLKLMGGFHLSFMLNKRKLRILCYHGFSNDNQYLFEDILFIRKETFERRMKILNRWEMNVIPLNDAVEKLPDDKHPDHSVVITFDDGWHSNLQALPGLKKYNYPATLYVASYYSLKGANVFNVLMRYLFWQTRSSNLVLDGIDSAIDGVYDLTDSELKNSCCKKIIDFGNQSNLVVKDKISAKVAEFFEIDLKDIESKRMFQYLNVKELSYLEKHGVSCELHTHRHQFPVDREIVEKEIADNRNSLNQVKSSKYNHLCYPSGVYSRAQFPWMRAMGIKSATTTTNGMNTPSTHLYELNRFLDRETLSDLEFEAEICGLTDLLKKLFRPVKVEEIPVYEPLS